MEIQQSDIHTLTEMGQARDIAEILDRKYPNWLWMVYIQDGLAFIRSMRISGRHGYVLHLDRIDNDGRDITRAGGEILERYAIARKKFNHDKWSELPMDFTGNLIGDTKC